MKTIKEIFKFLIKIENIRITKFSNYMRIIAIAYLSILLMLPDFNNNLFNSAKPSHLFQIPLCFGCLMLVLYWFLPMFLSSMFNVINKTPSFINTNSELLIKTINIITTNKNVAKIKKQKNDIDSFMVYLLADSFGGLFIIFFGLFLILKPQLILSIFILFMLFISVYLIGSCANVYKQYLKSSIQQTNEI